MNKISRFPWVPLFCMPLRKTLSNTGKNIRIMRCAGCQVPQLTARAKEATPRGSLRVVSGLAENTNSIFCDGTAEPEAANGCPVLLRAGTTSREANARNKRS
jgi:hypothetical protein